MSDWDNLDKDTAVPRNDPKIAKDQSFEDHSNDLKKTIRLGARLGRTLHPLSRQIENPKNKQERKQLVHQLMTNRKRGGVPTPVQSRRKTGINESALTAVNVILYFIALVVLSPIISSFKGVTSIIMYIGLWFVVRNIAKSFLAKF